jgi:hypothetical protein
VPSLLAQAQYLTRQHYECRKTVPSGVDNNRIKVVSNTIFRSCHLPVTRRVPLTELERTTGVSVFTLSCRGVAFVQSLVFCAVFCKSLFVLLSFLFWPLYCLSFHLRVLVTIVVSPNCSCTVPCIYFVI